MSSGNEKDLAGSLVKAAGQWSLEVVHVWKERKPDEFAAFKRLFDTGQAGVRISITLGRTPEHQVELVGVLDGQDLPIASQVVTPTNGAALTH